MSLARAGRSLLLLALMGAALPTHAQTNTVIPLRSVWKYWDANYAPAQNWMQPGFNDSQWTIGAAPLGFGQPNVNLIQNSIMTAYFRRTFALSNAPESWLTLRVRRDDGVLVFLNGTEIFRNNMPQGPISHYTAALQDVQTISLLTTNVGAAVFLPGDNTVAAEVHQSRLDSPDMIFDMELFQTNGGPRLVLTSPTNNAAIRTGVDLPIAALAEPLAAIASVAFYADDALIDTDTNAPFAIVWPQVPAGMHSLRTIATAHDGFNFGSGPVRIEVADAFPPAGAITFPPPNSTFVPGDLTLQASASDRDGAVTRVEFFANGVKLGEDMSVPYNLDWSSVGPGDYNIFARITDDTAISVDTPVVVLHIRSTAGVPRGPYLQSGTPTSIIVKWRTVAASDSVVRYGTVAGNLGERALAPDVSINHEVKLTGLLPNTRYFYSVGSSAGTQATGPDLFFITSAVDPKPTRIWVIGDSGTASPDARAVYQSYLAYAGSRYTDLWLMLGDNAYDSGRDEEYQRGMFDMYPQLLAQTVVWPTIGNHDTGPAYFDVFSLPRNGEAGGVPSGVENYYSFNYGDIHFISLGGYYSGSLASNATMCTWMKADLEANTNKWLIAFWHQPPYTHGSHNSDFEGELIEMRRNAVPILESYGVDLVLSGHSHSYERSHLLRGHYGFSWELDPATMVMDAGSG
ncbi:MAG TPA: Ig-like domain-containing protein, partial [Verrucomicrobiae bacterium]|nr:Ig-like domain-containing protein [Verrucomicrobiae bacterium]